MKKRIFELLKQATTDINPQDREWVFSRVDQVKFAELIVRECGRVYIQNQQDGVMTLTQDLLQHFGVEE
jgi:hypothetical protein